MMTVAVAVLAASVVCAAASFALMFCTQVSNHHAARNLADSVVARGVERLMASPDFRGSITIGEVARLSFETIPRSVNNLDGFDAVAGFDGHPVPAESAQLVGLGFSGGEQVRVEAILSIAAFPYALASDGRLDATDLLVSGVPSFQEVARGPDGSVSIKSDDELPGHVASNCAEASALTLGRNSRVKGNAGAAGRVVLSGGVVEGDVRNGAARVTLPWLEPSAFDVPRAYAVTLQPSVASPRVAGFARSEGGLRVSGDITLDGGVLFVKGDLYVEGGIRGRGAVIVQGRTYLGGASSLTSDDVAAIISGGDLTIEAAAGNRARHLFQGLVYGRGRVTARNVTVLGAMVAAGGDDLTVENTTVVSVPLGKLMIAGESIWQVDDEDPGPDEGDGSGIDFNAVAFFDRAAKVWRYDVRATLIKKFVPQQTLVQKGLTREAAVRFLNDVFLEAGTDESAPAFDAYLQDLSRGAKPRSVVMDVDLNRFLQPADRIRILLWRPL